MRNLVLGALLVAAVGAGCAGASATALKGSALDPGTVFFVENHGKDQRQLEQVIASVIRARGLKVSSGDASQKPADTAFLVTYQDYWGWDMRTFLREIRIQVRDVKTGARVAESLKYQSSLPAMGKTYEEIVRNATDQLFDGAR